MVIMAKGMDFESSDTKEASRAHSDFFPAAENRRLGASVASSSKSFFQLPPTCIWQGDGAAG
jgi:hypothetical protein